jgi:hypothetical protein
MKTPRPQSQPSSAKSSAGDSPSKKQAGLYGSQAPKPGARNPSGDTVVQAKPAGAKLHADKLSQPGYLEEAAEREIPGSSRGRSNPKESPRTPRPQRKP